MFKEFLKKKLDTIILLVYTIIVINQFFIIKRLVDNWNPFIVFELEKYLSVFDLIRFIELLILIITIVLVLLLKTKYKNESIEVIEKKKKLIVFNYFLLGCFISIIWLAFLAFNYYIQVDGLFIIGLIIIAISILVRLKSTEISNIICAILVIGLFVVVLFINTSKIVVGIYNRPILKYIKTEDIGINLTQEYAVDIESIIKNVIKKKNITISYQDKVYSSKDELNELLDIIKLDRCYSVDVYRNNNYSIRMIKIEDEYLSKKYNGLFLYDGDGQKFYNIKSVLSDIKRNIEDDMVIIRYYNDSEEVLEVKSNNINKIIDYINKDVNRDSSYEIDAYIDLNETLNVLIKKKN